MQCTETDLAEAHAYTHRLLTSYNQIDDRHRDLQDIRTFVADAIKPIQEDIKLSIQVKTSSNSVSWLNPCQKLVRLEQQRLRKRLSGLRKEGTNGQEYPAARVPSNCKSTNETRNAYDSGSGTDTLKACKISKVMESGVAVNEEKT